jgi:hypothetical protein
MRQLTLLVISVAAMAACAGTQRSPAMYRADTQKVLETRTEQIKRCYDGLLEKDAAVSGTVTVRFVVEKKTGTFTKATVEPGKTNAGEPLVLCVLEAMRGLKLDPPDAHEGQAMFSYDLAPPAPVPAPPT